MTVPAGYALGRIQDFVEGAIHWNISIPYPVLYIGKKVIIRLVPRVLTIQTI